MGKKAEHGTKIKLLYHKHIKVWENMKRGAEGGISREKKQKSKPLKKGGGRGHILKVTIYIYKVFLHFTSCNCDAKVT